MRCAWCHQERSPNDVKALPFNEDVVCQDCIIEQLIDCGVVIPPEDDIEWDEVCNDEDCATCEVNHAV